MSFWNWNEGAVFGWWSTTDSWWHCLGPCGSVLEWSGLTCDISIIAFLPILIRKALGRSEQLSSLSSVCSVLLFHCLSQISSGGPVWVFFLRTDAARSLMFFEWAQLGVCFVSCRWWWWQMTCTSTPWLWRTRRRRSLAALPEWAPHFVCFSFFFSFTYVSFFTSYTPKYVPQSFF